MDEPLLQVLLLLRSPKDPSRAAPILLVRDETCVAPQTGTVAVQ